MKVNKLCVILCCFLISSMGWAQKTKIAADLINKTEIIAKALAVGKPNHQDPVSLNATVVWSADKKQLAVVMKAVLLEQWHMYAYVPKTEPYIECELRLELPKGVTPIKSWEEPSSKPYDGGVFIYEGDCVFVRYCKVDSFNSGEKINSGLYYQTCDAKKCLPPNTKSVTITLE